MNSFRLTVALACLMSATLCFADSSLICHWKMDEGTGTTVNDSAGTAQNGTLVNALFASSGVNGGGAVMDGNGDHISVPDSSELNLTGSRTISAWVKPDQFGTMQVIAGKYIWNYGLWYSDTGKLRGYIASYDGANGDSSSNTPLKTGEWQHVAMTFDINGDRKVHIYINGKEVEYAYQNAFSGTRSKTDTNIFSIGSDYGTRYWFDGVIDDVRLYDRVLTEAEIFKQYTDLLTVGYFKFNEGTGSVTGSELIGDGAALSGTLVNGPQWGTGFEQSGLSFDGTNDYVNCGTSSLADLTGSRTISAWIKVDSLGRIRPIAGKYRWNYGLWLTEGGLLRAFVNASGSNQDADSLSLDRVYPGEWHHVAMTFDINGDKIIHLYLDGREVAYDSFQALAGTQTGTGGSYALTIGGDAQLGEYFNGLIDDVQLFKGALSQAGIAKLYWNSSHAGVWKMDESGGSIAYDSTWNLFNGSIIHATLGTGFINNGGCFDGDADRIEMINESGLNMPGSRTVSAWIKPDAFGNLQVIAGKYMWDFGLWLTEAGALRGYINSSTGSSAADSVSNDHLTAGKWHHVAMSFDIYGDKKVHLFINGREVDYYRQTALTDTKTATNTQNFSIGSDYGTRYWFQGKIDEVSVMYKPCTLEEMSKLYIDSALLGEWKLGEGSGTVAYDYSSNLYNGSIYNATWNTKGFLGANSLDFDGNGDYVRIGNVATMNMTGSRTLTAWIKPDSTGSLRVIAGKYIWNYGLWLTETGTLRGYVASGTGGTAANSISTEQIQAGKWSHVAMSFDIEGDKKVRLFINGREANYSAFTAMTGDYSNTSSEIFSIGSDYGTRYWFDGMIGDVAVHGRALHESEIFSQFMNQLKTPSTAAEFSHLTSQVQHPVFSYLFPAGTTERTAIVNTLKQRANVQAAMALSDAQLVALLPAKSGIYYVGCPVCGTGNTNGYNFSWDISNPNVIKCNKCNNLFPSTSYPDNSSVSVTAPSGNSISYNYYQGSATSVNPDGKYFFKAGVDNRKAAYFSEVAYNLARIYYLSTDSDRDTYANKAAIIICNIAAKYPDFVFKDDRPNRNIQWFNGTPGALDLLPDFRTSRWGFWAYYDMPYLLIQAYDLIYNYSNLDSIATSAGLSSKRTGVEVNFFQKAAEQTLLNVDDLGNMSPYFWQGLVIAGRVTGAPDYVHIVIGRIREYIFNSYFSNGFWREPSLSYHIQSVKGVTENVNPYLEGYSDVSGYNPVYSICTYSSFDPDVEFAQLQRGNDLLNQMIYPNYSSADKYSIRIGDTWATNKIQADDDGEKDSYFLEGLGHAALNGDKNGNQIQLHYAFSPQTSHYHYDTLGITLFAENREMISDIGYTHTYYDPWSTCTASHNTVVVDYKNFPVPDVDGKGKAEVEYVDFSNPNVQIISVDGKRAYYDLDLSLYRRTSFLIKKGGADYYVADFFDVEGTGGTFDYFLHGDASLDNLNNQNETVTVYNQGNAALTQTSATFATIPGGWSPPASESDDSYMEQYYAYGFFSNTKTVGVDYNNDYIRIKSEYNSNGFNVFVPIKDQTDLTVFTGKNPSIRLAAEDGSKVDDYLRSFICLRKTNSANKAFFSTVIQPFGAGGCSVQGVYRLNDNVLKVVTSSSTDYIFVKQTTQTSETINGKTLDFSGDYGYVSVSSSGIGKYHIVNGFLRYDNTVVVNNNVILQAVPSYTDSGNENLLGFEMSQGTLPQSGLANFIRLYNENEKKGYGYMINSIDITNNQLETRSPLGFIFNPQLNLVKFYYYPNIELYGKTKIIFFNSLFN